MVGRDHHLENQHVSLIADIVVPTYMAIAYIHLLRLHIPENVWSMKNPIVRTTL